MDTIYYRYCHDIVIYDLQQRNMWKFIVNKKLSVFKKVVSIIAEPMKEAHNGKNTKTNIIGKLSSLRIVSLMRYHMWLLCQPEYYFSHLKKITVILSTVLSLYVLVLLFYDLPTFHLVDGFDEHHYYIDTYSVIVAVAASLLAFLMHVFVVWYFRYSSRTTYLV